MVRAGSGTGFSREKEGGVTMVLERWRPGWGIRPWRPFAEELERRFEEILGRPFFPQVWRRLPGEERGWAPPLEMFEKEVKPKKVEISVK
jgi:hypothetical protein